MSDDDFGLIQRTIPKVASTVNIPLLSEVCLSVTGIVVAVAAGAVALASLLARAPSLVILMRTGITILVVGLIGYLFNWLVGKYLINATLEKFTEELSVRSEEELATDTKA